MDLNHTNQNSFAGYYSLNSVEHGRRVWKTEQNSQIDSEIERKGVF